MHAARRPLISAVIVWQRSATERDLEVRGRTRGGLAAVPAASSVALVVAYYEFAPMSSRERRIVHLALRDHEDLRTESEGMGLRRYVVVYPKDYKPVGKAARRTLP